MNGLFSSGVIDPQSVLNVNIFTEKLETVGLRLGQELELPWTASRLLSSTYEIHGDDLWIIDGNNQLVINDWVNLEEGLSWLSSDNHLLNGKAISSFIQPENIALASTTSYSDGVATVQSLNGEAWVTDSNGVKSKLSQGDLVFQGAIVETGSDSFIKISLVDKSVLTLGEHGKYVINDFSFDGQSQAGVTLMSILKGAFSFLSGLIARENPENVRIFTPTAEIGIRGTKIIGEVSVDGETEVILIQGRIVVSSESETYQIVKPLSGIRISDFTSSSIKFENIVELLSRYKQALPEQFQDEFFQKTLETSFNFEVNPEEVAILTLPAGFDARVSTGQQAAVEQDRQESYVVAGQDASADRLGSFDSLLPVNIFDRRGAVTTQEQLVAQSRLLVLKDADKMAVKTAVADLNIVEKVATGGVIIGYARISEVRIQLNDEYFNIKFNVSEFKYSKASYLLNHKVEYNAGMYKIKLSELYSESVLLQDLNLKIASEIDNIFIFVGLKALSDASVADVASRSTLFSDASQFILVLEEDDYSGKKPKYIVDDLQSNYLNLIHDLGYKSDPILISVYNLAPVDKAVILRDNQGSYEVNAGLIDKYYIEYQHYQGKDLHYGYINDIDGAATILSIKQLLSPKVENKLSPTIYTGLDTNIKYVDKFILELDIKNYLFVPPGGNVDGISDKLVVKFFASLTPLFSNTAIINHKTTAKAADFTIEIKLLGVLTSPEAKYELVLGSEGVFFEPLHTTKEMLLEKGEKVSFTAYHKTDGEVYEIAIDVYNDLDNDINAFSLAIESY